MDKHNPQSVEPASLAARFEQQWSLHAFADLAGFAAEIDEIGPSCLAGLVHVDQRQRHARKTALPAEFYFEKFPALRVEVELALDVVYQEYVLQREAGETGAAEALLNRFPDLAERLTMQFELDGALASEFSPATIAPRGAAANYAHAYASGTVLAGRYSLLEEIGEGGMGTVWAAEQTEPVRRRVAVKLIKPGMDSRQVLSRFEAERQALALMEHPNIARVLDGGVTDQGRPFFVMEYVEGAPITRYCDRNRLTVRQRLELFVQVCRAVQHAHQKGIIHRDLKPSNILVCPCDGTPVPKVIDFGLAKAMHQPLTEQALCTAHDMIVGTPVYMSPEQAQSNNLDIDTRSDVYSLGVILYELLTGGTPLETERLPQAAWPQIVRWIQEDEPARPSTRLSKSDSLPAIAAARRVQPAQLGRAVRGDLDWIVMKALEKERSRRYDTANGLARDLERYLRDDEVEARPPSARYRFGKFARRNKAALVTACLVAAALVVGITASTWQAIRATRAEGVAEAARWDEARQRQIAESERNAADAARAAEAELRRLAQAKQAEAEANFQKARAAVDKYFTLVSENELLDVPGLQPLRRDLLEAALQFYEGYRLERADDPALLVDLAVTYLRLGQIYLALDRADDGVASARRALDLIQQVQREHPDAREHLLPLAGFWKGQRWSQVVMQPPRQALAAWLVVARLEKTWQELAEQHAAETGFQVDLAMIRGLMGGLLSANDRFVQANEYYRQAIAGGEKILERDPHNPQYRADMAALSQLLADNLTFLGETGEALALTRRAVELSEALVAEFAQVPAYRSALAESLLALGDQTLWIDPPTAERSFRRAAQLGESLLHEFPGDRLFLEVWMKATVESVQFETVHDAAQAGEIAARLLATLEARIQERHGDPYFRRAVVVALERLGTRADARAHPELCEHLLQHSLDLVRQLSDEFPDDFEYPRNFAYDSLKLARLQRDKGAGDQARQSLSAAIEACARLSSAPQEFSPHLVVDLRLELADILRNGAQSEAALPLVEQAVDLSQSLIRDCADTPLHRSVLFRARSVLDGLLADVGRLDEARAVHQACLRELDEALRRHARDVQIRTQAAWTLGSLAESWPRRLDLDLCEQLHRRRLALYRELAEEFPGDPSHREFVAHACRHLARIERDKQELEASSRYHREAANLFQELADDDIPQRNGVYRELQADALAELTDVLATARRYDDALEAARQSVAAYDELVERFSRVPARVEKANLARCTHALLLLKQFNAELDASAFLDAAWSHRAALDVLRGEAGQQDPKTESR